MALCIVHFPGSLPWLPFPFLFRCCIFFCAGKQQGAHGSGTLKGAARGAKGGKGGPPRGRNHGLPGYLRRRGLGGALPKTQGKGKARWAKEGQVRGKARRRKNSPVLTMASGFIVHDARSHHRHHTSSILYNAVCIQCNAYILRTLPHTEDSRPPRETRLDQDLLGDVPGLHLDPISSSLRGAAVGRLGEEPGAISHPPPTPLVIYHWYAHRGSTDALEVQIRGIVAAVAAGRRQVVHRVGRGKIEEASFHQKEEPSHDSTCSTRHRTMGMMATEGTLRTHNRPRLNTAARRCYK
jgi:hypothetical protein